MLWDRHQIPWENHALIQSGKILEDQALLKRYSDQIIIVVNTDPKPISPPTEGQVLILGDILGDPRISQDYKINFIQKQVTCFSDQLTTEDKKAIDSYWQSKFDRKYFHL